MKYELFIQDRTGVWQSLDMNESPAMNYQVNNLAELKDRQASYSQNIKLPVTPANCRALGFANVFEVDTDIPYRTLPCRLLCDGINISGDGSVLFVDEITRTDISCQITSGVFALLEELGDLDMNDPVYNTIWKAENVGNSNPSARWLYPVATVDKGAATEPFNRAFGIFKNTSEGTSVEMKYLFPAVPFKRTVEYLLMKQGYSLVTNLPDYPGIESDYITIAKAEKVKKGNIPFDGLCQGYVTAPLPEQGYSVINMPFQDIADESGKIEYGQAIPPFPYSYQGVSGDWEGELVQGLTFSAEGNDTSITVDATLKQIDGSGIKGVVAVGYTTKDGQEISSVKFSQYFSFQTSSIASVSERGIDLSDGEKLIVGFIICLEPSQEVETSAVSFNCEVNFILSDASQDDELAYGDTFNVLAGLGFNNQSDFLKAFLQVYGLTMDVDHTSKTVYAYTMKEIYDRAASGEFYDWSGKIVLSDDNKHGFRLSSYAQSNFIKLQENTDDNKQESGVITIDDKTLESTKDLFTVSFESGINLTGPVGNANIKLANLPLYDVEEDEEAEGGIERSYSGAKAHLVRISDETVQLRITEDNVLKATFSLCPIIHIPQQEYVDTYYQYFQDGLLKRSRVVNASFLLDPLDVSGIDFFRPVYIAYYRCFFYISKISNFIAGQPVKVELVSLGIRRDEIYYTVTATVARGQENMGEASVYPPFAVYGGKSVFMSTPKEGIEFLQWVFSDGTTSNTPTTEKIITQNISGVAHFKNGTWDFSDTVQVFGMDNAYFDGIIK